MGAYDQVYGRPGAEVCPPSASEYDVAEVAMPESSKPFSEPLSDRVATLEKRLEQVTDQHDAFVRDTVSRILDLQRRLG